MLVKVKRPFDIIKRPSKYPNGSPIISNNFIGEYQGKEVRINTNLTDEVVNQLTGSKNGFKGLIGETLELVNVNLQSEKDNKGLEVYLVRKYPKQVIASELKRIGTNPFSGPSNAPTSPVATTTTTTPARHTANLDPDYKALYEDLLEITKNEVSALNQENEALKIENQELQEKLNTIRRNLGL